jgi:hypothetical protein
LSSSGIIPVAKAASLATVRDLLSDSDVAQTASHNIYFIANHGLEPGDYIEVALASTFGDISAANCPASFNPTYPSAKILRCTASAPQATSTPTSLDLTVINPSSVGSHNVSVGVYGADDSLREASIAVVAIVDNVEVSASVQSVLFFAISPLATSTIINGATTTDATGTTTVSFGNLQAGTSSILGQELSVITNANYGYKVTLEQDQDLTSTVGATIDAFQMGTPPVAPTDWTSPTAVLDTQNTYGHIGFTTDDNSLSGGNLFGGGKWDGLVGSSTKEIMYHGGVADGLTQNIGLAKVAFRIEVSPLQEAGDYANTLTYIATPTY